MDVTASYALDRLPARTAFRRSTFFPRRWGMVTAFALQLTAASATASQADCVGPETTPRLDVTAAVCAVGEPCTVSIDLSLTASPNEEHIKTASATLTSDKAITCASCGVETPAGYGNCILNAGACSFFLGDAFDLLNEFTEGVVATISLTCDEPGTHDLDLTGVSFGAPSGAPIGGSGRGFAITCGNACGSDLDCSSFDDACNVGTCDGGTGRCTAIPRDEGTPCNDPACTISCPTTLDPFCLVATRAKLDYDERRAGKEKIGIRWQKIETATAQGDYGDPVSGGTSVAACIYDDAGALVREFLVDSAGAACAGKPCWKTKGNRGYGYKDKDTSAAGVAKIDYLSGGAGQGKATVKGKNNAGNGQTLLPVGVAAAMSGNTAPTIQMITFGGFCVGATLDEIRDDGASRFRAQKR